MAPYGGIERRAIIVILASLLIGLGVMGFRAVQATGDGSGGSPDSINVSEDKDVISPVAGADGAGQHELPAPTEIVVHVCGAVKNPGVYRIAPSSRVADAVAAAGGGTASAYLERINLASTIFDGQQIYVPSKDEAEVGMGHEAAGGHGGVPAMVPGVAEAGPRSAAPVVSSPPVHDGLIDLNACSEQDLTSLKGIGPVLAQRIIEYRSHHGRFRSVSDLIEVPGIGPKKLESIKPYIEVR
ncbi:MAG TPA: ComEA family DNA-binding protein [Firmicutes bacterium]|nr:ComEA family DNA-binding protein [Bacillota bacterium]